MRRIAMVCLVLMSVCLLVVSPARAAGWRAEATALDLIAGPLATTAALAPDGSRFAYYKDKEWCLYTLDGEKGDCVALQDDISIDLESVRWSPDSTKLTFSENFFITFRDSDIWLWDTIANSLTDLTPTAYRELNFFSNDDPDAIFTVDVAPQWSADSRSIVFVRYQFRETDDAQPSFYRVNIDGGEAQALAKIKTNRSFSTYGFALSPDATRIAYNLDTRGDEQDGTWLLDVESGTAKFAAAAVQGTLPWAYEFSPAGDLVLVVGTSEKFAAFSGELAPFDSAIYTLPVAGGRQQQLDVDHFVLGAGWAPEGSSLAYVTYAREDQGASGLYIAPAPGQKGQLVLEGRFIPPTPTQRTPLTWASNNTLLLTNTENFNVVVVRLTPD